jgi:hypothetical protein
MKRLLITLSIIILLAAVFPCFHVLAQPTQIPHEYPPEDKPSLEASKSLLQFYYNVATLTAGRQYYDVQDLLEEIEEASIPDELQDIINLYSDISRELAVTLNNIEALHYEAKTLFSQNQFNETEEKLVDSEKNVSNALMLLEDLEEVSKTLGELLGVFNPLVGGDAFSAYERLVQNLEHIYQLIYELDQVRDALGLNPMMEITPKFYYTTLLEVSAPKTVYAGSSLNLRGQIGSTGARLERTINIYVDDTRIAQEIVREQFDIQTVLPQQISVGRHLLRVKVAPHGYYTSASKNLPFDIVSVPIRADIRIPQLLVFSKAIRISGNVYSGPAPVKDAEVSVAFQRATVKVRTSTDGSFTATTEVLDELFQIGPQELIITIDPVEPQYESLEIKKQIIYLSWANISVMLVSFLLIGMLLLGGVRTRLTRLRKEIVAPQVKLPELPTIDFPGSEYESTEIKVRILSAYVNGLGVVEKVTIVDMMPHNTIREYVNAASMLPAAIQPFTELSSIAENALYSSYKLDESTAIEAEELASIINEELSSGVA